MDDDLMPIGALARLSRLSVKALRRYDAEGLLAPERERAARGGWALAGPWCGLYPLDLGERPSVTLGAPLADPARADGAEVMRVAGGPVATTLHLGSYDELPLAYAALLAWAHERGHEPGGPIRETYLSDPARVPAPELVTRISVPVRAPGGPMNALFPDVLSSRLRESRDFYVALLGMEVVFDSDWYVLLRDPRRPRVQLAFVADGHGSVPAAAGGPARGVLITAEVEDVDAVHARALALGAPIAQGLRDEEFGQRHFMAVDPNGLLVDVYRPIPFSAAFLAENPELRAPGAP